MFAGRYSEAHELFRTYVDANSEVDDGEWHLKSLALAEIIKFLDIEKQARNHFEATRQADIKGLSPGDAEVSLNKVLRSDALCALAWFNLAVTAHAQKKPDHAFLGFLLAGLIGRTDPDAWANALLLSLSPSKYNSLVVAVTLVAYKINGDRFLDALRKVAERQQGFPAAKLLDFVREVVNAVESPKGGFEVRVLREGSSYDLIQLGSDLTPMLQFSEESTQPRPLNNKQDGH